MIKYKCKSCNQIFFDCHKYRKYCSKQCYNLALKQRTGKKAVSFKHGMTNTPFYVKWTTIKQRCYDKNYPKYKIYGARGIKCFWKSFEDFKEDMYKSYIQHVKEFGEKQTTIDRIDNNGNYCKENCRWATAKEQANNRNTNKIITYKGESLNIKQWSEKTGINNSTLYQRIVFRKWPIEKCFDTKMYNWRKNTKL